MINISDIINGKTELNSETLPELEEYVTKYPFFQAARLLYINNLFALHSSEFGKELRKASVFVPDRTTLFNIVEGNHYDIERQNNPISPVIETENEDNRTITLINNFLSNQADDNSGDKRTPSIADLTTDYASFLIQQDDTTAQPAESASPKLKGNDLIESFIKETKGKQRIEIPEGTDENYEYTSPEISSEDEEIYTENMVNIYIKQGRYEQALEILRKICLNNPKKSSNFASQMKLLEIIINNK